MEWQRIFANDATDKGLISKIYKQLIQFNNNKNTIEKLAGEIEVRRYIKRCSSSITIRDKQMNATIRYHHT